MGGVRLGCKGQIWLEVLQNRGRSERLLQAREGHRCCCRLGELDSFASEGGKRGSERGVVVNKFSIEVSKPKERLNLLDLFGGRPVKDGRNFCRVHADASLRDEVADEGHLRLTHIF